jgi:hypothetical protein
MEDKEQLARIEKQLSSLCTAICGNDELGIKGIVREQAEIRREIEMFKTLKWKIIGAGTIVAIVVNFILTAK